MPQVTSVEPQKALRLHSGRKRFSVFIDGQFAFGADDDLVVSHRLIVGKNLAKEDLDKLLFEAEVGKLMDRIYGLFSIRQRSEREVRDYLKNLSYKRKIKGQEEISPAASELLVNRLKEKGLINDLEFARAWTEARRHKQKGSRAIKLELFQKGINREIIEEVLGNQTEENEEELAGKALEKRLKSWKNLDKHQLYQKAVEYLLRKGFDFEVAKTAVNKFLNHSLAF